MWANFVRDVIIIAFFVTVGMPTELYGDSWNYSGADLWGG